MKLNPLLMLLFSLALVALGYFWGSDYWSPSAASTAGPASSGSGYSGTDSDHAYWANKVVEGGYILHFRHAQREKWTDVTGFDALELHEGLAAEEQSFRRATCLTPRGEEEAKLIGAIFRLAGVSISRVYTSPSCRARMTSDLAFGGSDFIVNALLHRTAIVPEQHREAAENLREVMLQLEIAAGTNVVLSGHGGTLGYDKDILFTPPVPGNLDKRDEAGFVVIERDGDEFHVRHVFTRFSDFVNNLVELDITSVIAVRPPRHAL